MRDNIIQRKSFAFALDTIGLFESFRKGRSLFFRSNYCGAAQV
jgi:hypothetical protein